MAASRIAETSLSEREGREEEGQKTQRSLNYAYVTTMHIPGNYKSFASQKRCHAAAAEQT